ncbi:hypothetical protein SHJG_1581 [Streptomyces hygroscopicus subsp. jinggangensis 5008]|nr:hypothetical protein SHJG_1581 [Streptomyces hygroscopicus subsp. jinggangensis 5008]
MLAPGAKAGRHRAGRPSAPLRGGPQRGGCSTRLPGRAPAGSCRHRPPVPTAARPCRLSPPPLPPRLRASRAAPLPCCGRAAPCTEADSRHRPPWPRPGPASGRPSAFCRPAHRAASWWPGRAVRPARAAPDRRPPVRPACRPPPVRRPGGRASCRPPSCGRASPAPPAPPPAPPAAPASAASRPRPPPYPPRLCAAPRPPGEPAPVPPCSCIPARAGVPCSPPARARAAALSRLLSWACVRRPVPARPAARAAAPAPRRRPASSRPPGSPAATACAVRPSAHRTGPLGHAVPAPASRPRAGPPAADRARLRPAPGRSATAALCRPAHPVPRHAVAHAPARAPSGRTVRPRRFRHPWRQYTQPSVRRPSLGGTRGRRAPTSSGRAMLGGYWMRFSRIMPCLRYESSAPPQEMLAKTSPPGAPSTSGAAVLYALPPVVRLQPSQAKPPLWEWLTHSV